MVKTQFSSLIEKPYFLLGLILVAFLAREAFLAITFPLFTGQDEARHYNTIQWLSEEQVRSCEKTATDKGQDKEDLSTYRFSEEIQETNKVIGLGIWREENYRKPSFTAGSTGLGESILSKLLWTKQMTICPPDIVSNARGFSLYHWLGNLIERTWWDSDILTRFYLIRLLSVLLGALTIVFTYFATREAGFSARVGLLLALLASLQPKLATYTTNINYDALLIPCFALFTWAGIRWLQRGPSLLTASLLILALGGAALTKGTGLILLGGGLFILLWTLARFGRRWWQKLSLFHWVIGGGLLLGLASVITISYSLMSLLPNFSPSSLFEYLGKSLPKIPSSSRNFWGVISWTSFNSGHIFVWAIWIIEAVGVYGLVRFFRNRSVIDFLPSRSIVLFLITLFFSLQFGVRLHDWHVFQETGALLLGTPGRYFLPTLLAQLFLVTVGLGTLLKKPFLLERSLLVFTLLILVFHLYNTWLVIIPRFYL